MEVKTARRGEDKADQEPVPPWKAIAWLDQAKKRDKERAQADKPTVRNPNQTARDMGAGVENMQPPNAVGRIEKGLGELFDNAPSGIEQALRKGIPAGWEATNKAKDALFDKKTWMNAGEAWKRKDVAEIYAKHQEVIDESAAKYDVDPDLLRAIIKEEVSHQIPLENTLESLGLGDSVGPCQIRVSTWGSKYGLTRNELQNEAVNIATTARILAEEKKRLEQEGYEVTPEMLATRYNNGFAKKETDYGMRVKGFLEGIKQRNK